MVGLVGLCSSFQHMQCGHVRELEFNAGQHKRDKILITTV